MNTREPNYRSHRVTPRRVTRSHHDRVVSGTRQKTDLQPQEMLIVRSALRTHSEFVQAIPHEATAVDTSSPLPVAAVAAIPEAGMCGFDWETL
jgi:hypothetical protein